MEQKQLVGQLNVPADCVRTLRRIRLHAARAPGVNEPTEQGVAGTERILGLVQAAHPDDVCFCLLSGGGSALLPAPIEGVSLQDKLQVTRLLSSAGANIQQLNTVRKQLSRVKGGRLAQACRAGQMFVLIISDVLGDPLDVIASGPTSPDSSTAADALQVLRHFAPDGQGVPNAVLRRLEAQARGGPAGRMPSPTQVVHQVIGNNALAVDAAGQEAERRGYAHAMQASRTLEGPAESVGQQLAEMALHMQNQPGPDCLISGGEPTVELVAPELRGKGGRNQQLVLAALQQVLARAPGVEPAMALQHIALLSGGTDGEDGPTDAAGAWIDADVARAMSQRGMDPATYLRRNDAYTFFDPLGALLRTGPTHTNVCDVRVITVSRSP
jgi:hydroxypyruvate reductase